MLATSFATIVVLTLMFVSWVGSSSPHSRALVSSFGGDVGNPARLPQDLLPLDYKIKLMPFIYENNFTTNGDVWITLECMGKTNEVVVNINDIAIYEDNVELKDVDNNVNIPIAFTVHDEDLQFYTLHLGEDLTPGKTYRLYLKFLGQLNDLLQGFYRSSYYDKETDTTRWLAATQFSPTDARRAFPCLDEPEFKAKFQISIARETHMRSLSNMPIAATIPVDDQPNWVWDEYSETVQMSTYLVAFIVSDFKSVDATLPSSTNGFKFFLWTHEDALNNTQYAADNAPQMLRFLENYFNIPFPLPKQDMVAVPDFGFRAMENWGLITYRESAMLFEKDVSTETNKQSICEVMGHELAHQWFGNLVTPQWWNDLWLKEGFATFIGNVAVDSIHPDWKIKDQFTLDKIQGVFQMDALESSHPISVPVDHPDQIRQIFDSISYDKGASIIRMMSHFLGEETFKAGLTLYLNTFKFSNARQDDLWNSLNEQAHHDNSLPEHITVQLVMDTWTLQTGFPVVTITRDYNSKTATITQQRFLLSGSNEAFKANLSTTWWIPVTYTTASVKDFEETQPKLWLENVASITIDEMPARTEWVIFNIQETGYYRVNYDEENWKLLTADFLQLPDTAQAQLVDDGLNLAIGGYINYDIALDLTSSLKDSTEFLPWIAAMENMEFLDQMLALSDTDIHFKTFMLSTLDKLYEQLQFEEKPSDSHVDILNRVNVLKAACHYGHTQCVANAKEKYQQWMNGKDQLDEAFWISANQKDVVYCTAIGHGENEEWEFAWQQYQLSNLGSEKEQLLDALGCSQYPEKLESYLQMILANNSGIRKQDGARVFSAVARNVVGHSIAFDFLRENWDELQSFYGLAFSSVSNMVKSIGTFMKTPAELLELEQFRDLHIDQLGTTERSFNQTIEKVQINVYWMENNFEEVKLWLQNYVNRMNQPKWFVN